MKRITLFFAIASLVVAGGCFGGPIDPTKRAINAVLSTLETHLENSNVTGLVDDVYADPSTIVNENGEEQVRSRDELVFAFHAAFALFDFHDVRIANREIVVSRNTANVSADLFREVEPLATGIRVVEICSMQYTLSETGNGWRVVREVTQSCDPA